MLSNIKKFICSWVVLAILLVPFQFAVASDVSNLSQELMTTHHPTESNHHTMDMDVVEVECGGQNVCSDCVYCSPAINISNHFLLDKLLGAQPVVTVSVDYTIALPVDIRPPKLL